MVKPRFSEEFKSDAVKHVVERSYPVLKLRAHLSVPAHSRDQCLKRYDPKRATSAESTDQ